MDACFFLLTDDSNISQPYYNGFAPQLLPWRLLSLKLCRASFQTAAFPHEENFQQRQD